MRATSRILGGLALAWLAAAALWAAAGTGRLVVTVEGLDSNRGRLALALFDSAETYAARGEPCRRAFVAVDERGGRWEVEGLPPGEYVLAFYHDRNGNGELDKNKLGVPKEPYGFSGNARALFGRPSFEAARFTVEEGTTTLVLSPR
jgi:uncharacterized protein (DUF2141 family)